jgi:hypothetical protein
LLSGTNRDQGARLLDFKKLYAENKFVISNLLMVAIWDGKEQLE